MSLPEFPDYTEVADVSEIPAGQGRAYEVAGKAIAIFNCDGQFFAIDDQCPHMGASLAAGFLEGCVVSCPWHAWRFDVRDGTWVDNPRIKTDAYPLQVVAGKIWIGPKPLPPDP